jgi:hypothetical protein
MQVEKLATHRREDVWVPNLVGEPLPPRRRVLTPIQEQQAIGQATEWLDKRVVERIRTPPLVNNLVLVGKKDGRTRVCVDCTPANLVTSDYDWPLPRLQDIRYRVQGKTWFSRIDLRDAFFRIGVPAIYRHLTCFMAGGQAYQFLRMPFGLKTAPSVFQRFMDKGLSDLAEMCFWYIDDILISATSLQELRRYEKTVRRRLLRMGCEINETKSESEKRSVLFAGLWVFGEGIGPNSVKLAEVRRIPTPTNKVQAQSALGLVSYLRDFVPLVGHFTAMLYPDKEGIKLEPAEYDKQWKELIGHLSSAATTTRHWRDGVDADLYTDASGYAVGAVLLQQGRVVALASRKLSPAETRYSATDREHLGLVFAADRLKLFLHQSNATTSVWTDHSALVTRKAGCLTPRQARWHTLVQAWMPNVRHVKGKLNPADFISRWKSGAVGANF